MSQGKEKLSCDQVTTKNKEEINANPSEAMPVVWKLEAVDSRVVKYHQDDRERPQEIESGLTFALDETWV